MRSSSFRSLATWWKRWWALSREADLANAKSRSGDGAAFLFASFVFCGICDSSWVLTFFGGHRIVKSFVADGGVDRMAGKALSLEYDPSPAVLPRPLL